MQCHTEFGACIWTRASRTPARAHTSRERLARGARALELADARRVRHADLLSGADTGNAASIQRARRAAPRVEQPVLTVSSASQVSQSFRINALPGCRQQIRNLPRRKKARAEGSGNSNERFKATTADFRPTDDKQSSSLMIS